MTKSLSILLFTAVILTGHLSAEAQPTRKVPRIAMLLYSNPHIDPNTESLRQALRELGYHEGRSAIIDYRFAEGRPERLPELAAELVSLKPDVIVALGGDVAPAAQAATASIPIVAFISNDPIQAGFAATLARPGKNVTGVTLILDTLAGKRLALLKELAPRVERVAIVWNPDHADPEFRECQRAARALGIQLQSLEVRRPADFDFAFQTAGRERSETIIVVSSRLVNLHRRQIVDFAARNRLPLVADWGPWSENGAVLTYGPNIADMTLRAAGYVDRILKGAKPADLPFLQPTRFQLIVNTSVARSLGITVPQSLLIRADQVIE